MINDEQINLYWNKRHRPVIRAKADEIADQVQIHSRRIVPLKILNEMRPNETDAHRAYRVAVYKPRTYGSFQKVLQQFVKIRRAEDWRVEWPATANNPLKVYSQENFGEYTTVENWYFNFYLRNVIDDPNGALIWLPANFNRILSGEPLNPTESFRPVPFYFTTREVRDYTPNLLVVDAKEPAIDAQGRLVPGATRDAMYFFDADEIVKVVITSAQDRKYSIFRYQHNLGFTGQLNGGLVFQDKQGGATNDDRTLYDSFIAAALPFWDDSIGIYSDHQVNLALHIHPERWEVTTKVCTNKIGNEVCNEGKIKVRMGRGPAQIIDCPACQGGGHQSARTPFGKYLVSPYAVGMNKETMPPTPPFGYAERPVETIKTVKELADDAVYSGFAALNLEMISQTPLNISGKAKELDRQETETYITLVSDWSIDQILTNGYYYMARWLFPGMSDEQLKKYLPTINRVRKFDLVTTDVWAARVAAYKTDGAASTVQAEAEIKLAERQYGVESTAFQRIRASIQLDPLYGASPEDKNLALLGGGCSREDYIISTKIGFFLTRALREQSDFYSLDFMAQTLILVKYAQETIAPVTTLGNALNGLPATQ